MKSISQFWTSFEQAWDSHDAAAVARHFEEDSVLIFFDGREFHGRKAIAEFYSDVFFKMPSAWVHRASIEEEAGWSASGVVQIAHAFEEMAIVRARYAIELSSTGCILRLSLRKRDLNQNITGNSGASPLRV
jgi:hypothetical protein